MLAEGQRAPSFSLPGCVDRQFESHTLQEYIEQDSALLLLFYPFDFSPVCTNELCAIRDAEWFQLTSDVDVWAISGDSVYAHRAFASEYDLHFPLLSDSQGNVADAYDVCYDEWENHERVPQRAVYLVDTDQTVQYAWQTEDAYEKPDFFPVKEALDELTETREDVSVPELSIAYNDGPGEIA